MGGMCSVGENGVCVSKVWEGVVVWDGGVVWDVCVCVCVCV